MQQRSEEWFKAKCGVISSSRINDACSGNKTAAYKNLVTSLVLERITGEYEQSYISKPMQWGIDHEDEARAMYEAETGNIVMEVGFILKQSNEYLGCSPDGLVGDDGLIEIKCPNSSTHMDTILTKKVSLGYIRQMQWQMFITGRQWCDFVSYDPRHPAHVQLFIKRIKRDENIISDLVEVAGKVLQEVDNKIAVLEKQR